MPLFRPNYLLDVCGQASILVGVGSPPAAYSHVVPRGQFLLFLRAIQVGSGLSDIKVASVSRVQIYVCGSVGQ